MPLNVRSLLIQDVKLVTPKRSGDARGFFVESWNRKAMAEAGITADFCQDNQSQSGPAGTVRGLHFQKPPHAQAKLVNVLRGRIFDVAVDLRKNAPTFGQFVTAELDATIGMQIFIPPGFAHGFCTLEPDTIVFYKVDAHYAPESDAGIFWADPKLEISWPVTPDRAVLSPRDAALPSLSDIVSPF